MAINGGNIMSSLTMRRLQDLMFSMLVFEKEMGLKVGKYVKIIFSYEPR